MNYIYGHFNKNEKTFNTATIITYAISTSLITFTYITNGIIDTNSNADVR